MNSKYTFSTSFTDDFTKNNIHHLFSRLGVPEKIIEIGTFEGGTAVYISDQYLSAAPDMHIYCIDPHSVSDDLAVDMELVRQRFLYNISVCSNQNIEYIQKPSSQGLLDLINQNYKAQFIYLDGDHKGSTVLTDLVLSFMLLEPGGIILCDDTNWKHPADSVIPDSPCMTPRMAVENFIQCNWHRLRVSDLPNGGSQTAIIKLSD